MSHAHDRASSNHTGLQAILFAVVAIAWLVFDQATKAWFQTSLQEGNGPSSDGPFAWLFHFRLVHNTGGAWGVLSDGTVALGILSVVLCILILIAFILFRKRMGNLMTVALALIFAGGLGNAIDRFANGHVIDFIDLSFMDFPVFNIADIGVTCGMVIFLICAIFGTSEGVKASSDKDSKVLSDDAPDASHSEESGRDA